MKIPHYHWGKVFWRVVVNYWCTDFKPHGSQVAKPLHLCTVPSVLSKQVTKAVILAEAACMLSLTTVSSPLKTPEIFFSYISHNFFLPVELSVGHILNCHSIPPRNPLCRADALLHDGHWEAPGWACDGERPAPVSSSPHWGAGWTESESISIWRLALNTDRVNGLRKQCSEIFLWISQLTSWYTGGKLV